MPGDGTAGLPVISARPLGHPRTLLVKLTEKGKPLAAVTMPLGPNDPRPEIAFPKDFLMRLSQADIQAAKAKAGKHN